MTMFTKGLLLTLAFALAACGAPSEPAPATPEMDAAPVAETPPPAAPDSDVESPATDIGPQEATAKPQKTKQDEGSGASCSIRDSNGPEAGGERIPSGCPEGEVCVCEVSAGYSCAGKCRPGRTVGGLTGTH